MKKKKKIWTHEGPSIKKRDAHMKAREKKKRKEKEKEIAMFSKIKIMRQITDIKEYSIGLALLYPHTCTS
jgi:hypothetical protein